MAFNPFEGELDFDSFGGFQEPEQKEAPIVLPSNQPVQPVHQMKTDLMSDILSHFTVIKKETKKDESDGDGGWEDFSSGVPMSARPGERQEETPESRPKDQQPTVAFAMPIHDAFADIFAAKEEKLQPQDDGFGAFNEAPQEEVNDGFDSFEEAFGNPSQTEQTVSDQLEVTQQQS